MRDQHRCIELVEATAGQAPILTNLLSLYIHELSTFFPVTIGPEGRFDYPLLPLYWSEPDRHAFLVQQGSSLAGFALVQKTASRRNGARVWDMAEFFILRSHRRRGLGVQAAHAVWCRFPGRWQVRVLAANEGAASFWQRSIEAFAAPDMELDAYEQAGAHWHVISFTSPENEQSFEN